MSAGVCILALSVMMTAYLNCLGLINRKSEVGQLARKYILRMETVGFLTEGDRTGLLQELDGLGVQNVDLSGTTMSEAGYGSTIVLKIRGTVPGEAMKTGGDIFDAGFEKRGYSISELRMSTAKN